MRWTAEETKEVIRLFQQERMTVPQIAKFFPNRSISAVRHLTDRLFERGDRPNGKSFIVKINDRATESMLADRDRRMGLPDTLETFFGDPKPGSGQSALEHTQE